MTVVDALSGLLDGPRARGAFVLRSVLDPPWGLRIQDEAPLTLVALVRGRAWITPDDAEPVPMAEGDVAVLRGPTPYEVADQPATRPQVLIHPGQRCETLGGASLEQDWALGVRTWGTNPDGAAVLLTGTYEGDGELGRPLLRALPPVLVLDAADADASLIGLLAREVGRDEPGQEAVLDRLLDLLLIHTLRAHFARGRTDAPVALGAYGDPVVGRALRLLEHQPAHPWTVAALARATHVSRAALARRFHDLVGQPPIAYLTGWRLALAADLLRGTDASIDSVARHVGYGSAFAFSTAFKRNHGVSPSRWRAERSPPRSRSGA